MFAPLEGSTSDLIEASHETSANRWGGHAAAWRAKFMRWSIAMVCRYGWRWALVRPMTFDLPENCSLVLNPGQCCLPNQHPAEKQPQRSDLLQPLSLPCSQPGRAVLQQDQTMSSGGDALRQAGRQLPCLRSTRVNQAMAASLWVRVL